MTQTATRRPAVNEAEFATPAPAALGALPEPGPAGISLFLVISLLLALKLTHAIPASSTLALVPIFFLCGLGQLILGILAVRNGEHVVGIFLSVFGPFLMSFGLLVLGLVHLWFPVPPADIPHVESAFVIGWTAVVTLFLLLSPVISKAFAAMLVGLDAALWFFDYSLWNTSDSAGKIAGYLLYVVSAGAAYFIASRWLSWAGFDVLPLGRPLIRPRPLPAR
jgi:uncharacterized protein